MKKNSKTETVKEIEIFFKNLKDGKPKEVKKIKRLAMRHGIKLGDKRKLFCKNCYSIFSSGNSQIRIKDKRKIIKCNSCGHISKWRLT